MTETQSESQQASDRGSAPDDGGAGGGDASNRSEREDLGSFGGSSGGVESHGSQGDTITTTPDAPGDAGADLGPNGGDSRLGGGGADGDTVENTGGNGATAQDAGGAVQTQEAGVRPQPGAGGDQAVGYQQAGEKNAAGQPAGDSHQAGDHRGPVAGDHRAGGHAAGDQKAGDHKGGDQKAGDHKAGDQKAGDQKQDALDPKALTKGDISNIIANSKDLNDLKLNLGLGPVTDAALVSYLESKGFTAKDFAPAAHGADGGGYKGPSIGPDTHGPIVHGSVYVTNSDGSTSKVEVTGTKEQIEQMQHDANAAAGEQMVKGLASALAKTGTAVSKGPDGNKGGGSPGSGPRW